jgi:hypothetical protein
MADSRTILSPDVTSSGSAAPQVRPEFTHALLFTGHMIDRPARKTPRFPAWAEPQARQAIHAAIAALGWKQPGSTVGLAAAASGGDLLFHECCEELNIPTVVLLALSPEEFEAESVAPSGGDWVARYRALLSRAGPRLQVMQETDGLLEKPTENLWQRANLWMIEVASRLASERALLALWDGSAGDGPGGTAHFLQIAGRYGVRVLPPIAMQAVLKAGERIG